MRRVEKEPLRSDREDDVRIAKVEGDVPLSRALSVEGLGELLEIAKGVPEDQATPAALDDRVFGESLGFGSLRFLPVSNRQTSLAFESMIRVFSMGGHDTPVNVWERAS